MIFHIPLPFYRCWFFFFEKFIVAIGNRRKKENYVFMLVFMLIQCFFLCSVFHRKIKRTSVEKYGKKEKPFTHTHTHTVCINIIVLSPSLSPLIAHFY